MAKPIIFVTGKNGQLGNELQVIAGNYTQFEFVFADSTELNITDEEHVAAAFQKDKPAYFINAAAYTAVDKAEAEQELAMWVNAKAVGSLAAFCKKFGAAFLHISTDYVFNGNATSPYKEDAAVDPVNYYGLTKLKGEEAALRNNADSIIIRTSWVYSFFGSNFVKTMLRLMKERESIGVVNDQYGSPTYAADLAEAIMTIIISEKMQGGIYHFSNQGIISWFDFATAIKELTGLRCDVKPIPTSAYPTPAKRPSYSAFDKQKIQATFGVELRDWKDSLARCIRLLTA